MTPATYDFDVVRGTAGPTQGITFRLRAKDEGGEYVNIPYEDVRLSIYKRNTLLLRRAISDGGLVLVDPVTNEMSWRPTAEETRLIPKGPNASYELEVWNGEAEIVYMLGTINGIGGINDDIGGDEVS